MAQSVIKKKFQISEAEFIEFSKKSMIQNKIKMILLVGIVFFVASVALTYKQGIWDSIFMSIILLLIYLLLTIGLLFITTPFMAKKVYTKNKIGEYVFDLEFNTLGIKQNKEIYYYKQFPKVMETKLSFYFYLLNKQIIVVSKRVFDEQELDDLRSLLQKSKGIKKLKLFSSNKKEK